MLSKYEHSYNRLIERYNIDLTFKDFDLINKNIQTRADGVDKIFIRKKSKRISVWIVRIKNRWVVVYYDKNRHSIATILPVNVVSKHLDVINSYLKGR